jgi:hypothetical protein
MTKAPSSNPACGTPEKLQAPNMKRRRVPFGRWLADPSHFFIFKNLSISQQIRKSATGR